MPTKKNKTGLSIAIQSTIFSRKNGKPLIEKKQPSEYTVKIANCLEEKEAVFRMAYQVYLEKGYIKENPNQWLVQSYDFEEDTIILIVQDKEKNIVGTVTLVFDGKSKLPAQKIYSEEIRFLKASKEKVVEISRLVIKPVFRNSKEILVLLFNYLAIYSSLVKEYTCLAIEVNPRHKNYYKELLGFEEIGGEKPCPSVQNAPAILLYLPLQKYHLEVDRCQKGSESNKKDRTLYPYFIKPEQENLVAHYLKNQTRPMRAEEKSYFGFTESGATKAVSV